MQVKNKKVIVLSIIGLILGVLLTELPELGICNSSFCYDVLSDIIGVAIGFYSISLLLISFILLFLRSEIYASWWKFARIYLPLALLLILIMGLSSSDGSWGVSADFDAEITIWLTSGLFLVISLIIIAVKSWKLRKGNQKV